MKNINFDKHINYLIVAYAFLIVTTAAGTVLIEHMLIILFLLKGDFKNLLNQLKTYKVITVLTLFIAFSFLSILWSNDTTYALIYLKKYYHFLSIPIIVMSFNPKYIPHVFVSFLSGILLSVIFSYGIFFDYIKYNNVLQNDPSPFLKAQAYSLYLSFASIILLNKFFYTPQNKHKIIYFLFFLVAVSNLFVNSARTGQFIFITSLFLIFFLNFKNKFKAIAIATCSSIFIITIAFNISPIFKERGNQAYNDIKGALINKDYSDSFGQRVSLWIMGANVFSENIILGTGIGDETNGMQKYANKYKFTLFQGLPDKGFIDYHSMYVQHAVQLGIIGLALTIYLIYQLFIIEFKSTFYRNLNITFATSILIFSIVGNTLHAFASMTFFTFFVAFFISISKYETKT